MNRKRLATLAARRRMPVSTLLGFALAFFLAVPASGEESARSEADETPLVVSYRTIVCDRPPCLPVRKASRPPDFQGSFSLSQQVFMCRTHPCGRPPYGPFVVTAEGLSHQAKEVVLHGERSKHNLPYYYTHRIAGGEVERKLAIEGDVWFDEKADRIEILARRIVPRDWEADLDVDPAER